MSTPRLEHLINLIRIGNKHALACWLLLAPGCICAAAAVDVRFDQPSDLASFAQRNEYQFTLVDWNPTGGVGDSGALRLHSAHYLTHSANSFDFSVPGAKLAAAAMFRINDPGPLSRGEAVGYGSIYMVHEPQHFTFVGDSASVFVDTASFTDGERSDRIFGGSIPDGAGSFLGFDEQIAGGSLQPDHWYRVQVTYQNLWPQLGWSVEIFDHGLDGLSPPGIVRAMSAVRDDTFNFGLDSTVYFGMSADAVGNSAIDNFSIRNVPEPTTTIPMAIAVVALSILRLPHRVTARMKRTETMLTTGGTREGHCPLRI